MTSPSSCGRAVKALDLKSNGVSPRRFESGRLRNFFIINSLQRICSTRCCRFMKRLSGAISLFHNFIYYAEPISVSSNATFPWSNMLFICFQAWPEISDFSWNFKLFLKNQTWPENFSGFAWNFRLCLKIFQAWSEKNMISLKS